jgi:DNA primase
MAFQNTQLTPQLVQAVRDAVDIMAIAAEHTRLRKAGKRYQGLCPLHKEKTPSFSIDPSKGVFYCFGCGAGGDAIKLHMLSTGDDFPAAIEALATRYGIPLPKRGERAGSRPERDLEGALAAAASFFAVQLEQSTAARQYLADRRVPPELVSRFGLGYAPDDWRALATALHAKVPAADLEAAGLVARSERRPGELYDRFRHRLVFPIHNAAGRLVGFGGRTLGDDKAKYVNTAETDRFHKGTLLYGLHQAKQEMRESSRAILVEGYFDVLATVACGREAAVAGMGTALTPEQAKLLSRYAEEVIVAYDGDSAGENAFRRAMPLLLAEGLAVRRARFGAGHDPDSLRLAEGEEAVAAAIDGAEDAVTMEIDRLARPEMTREPRTQAKAAGEVAELLRPIPDPILRYSYARIAAERLKVPLELLARRAGGGAQPAGRGVAASGAAGGRGVQGAAGRPGQPGQPGQGERPGSGGPGREAAVPSLVRSTEEAVLERLLKAEGPIPALAELPPPEVFFDAGCRNIYRIYCALYAGEGSPPEARAVMAELGSAGSETGVVDRMARILVEESVGPGKKGLLESLENLQVRFREQRLRELVGEMREAQRRGDLARLDQLSQEKTLLSQSLHRGSRPGARG